MPAPTQKTVRHLKPVPTGAGVSGLNPGKLTTTQAAPPDDVTFTLDLPDGWRPPPAAVQAILRVMLAVQQRRKQASEEQAA